MLQYNQSSGFKSHREYRQNKQELKLNRAPMSKWNIGPEDMNITMQPFFSFDDISSCEIWVNHLSITPSPCDFFYSSWIRGWN